MRIIPLVHQAFCKLVLIGLLLSPFTLAPSYATELVGKPISLNAHAVVSPESSAQSTSVPSDHAVPEVKSVESAESPQTSDEVSPQEDIHHAMEELGESLHQDIGSGFGGFNMTPDLLIPIVAMTLLFGGPVLLVIILAILHYRAKARRQHNINANIDKLLAAGRDIPVELLLGEEATAVKRSDSGEVTVYRGSDDNMQKGVRNIGLGTGWLIFLTIMFGIKIGAFGFIFIGLGISQVVIWKLSGSSSNPISSTQATRVQE